MIIVVMGVSGVGKTTIGTLLAQQLNIPFYDGDDFHPEANITKKMRHGIPLTDSDRLSWLHTLRDLIHKLAEAQQSAVIACSALKTHTVRCLQRAVDVRFVFLYGSYDLIRQRLQQRQHHFMSVELLQSQFDTLETPEGILTVEVNGSPDTIATTIRRQLTSQQI